ncbi:MAG: hypothetical protein EBY29_13140 [Planctomycetes bacterium]|nr:hypothetical protein [Planctomycetota bacterium]
MLGVDGTMTTDKVELSGVANDDITVIVPTDVIIVKMVMMATVDIKTVMTLMWHNALRVLLHSIKPVVRVHLVGKQYPHRVVGPWSIMVLVTQQYRLQVRFLLAKHQLVRLLRVIIPIGLLLHVLPLMVLLLPHLPTRKRVLVLMVLHNQQVYLVLLFLLLAWVPIGLLLHVLPLMVLLLLSFRIRKRVLVLMVLHNLQINLVLLFLLRAFIFLQVLVLPQMFLVVQWVHILLLGRLPPVIVLELHR